MIAKSSGVAAGAILAALVCLPTGASAQGTWFTNEASFLAAVTVTGFDTYGDLTSGFYAGPLSRLSGALSLSATNGLYKGAVAAQPTISTNNPEPLNFAVTGFDSIGALWNLTDINFNALDGSASFEIRDSTNNLISSYNHTQPTATSFFIGYVGQSSLTNLKLVAAPGAGTPNRFIGTEKTYLGNAVPSGGSAVPEPGEWAAMGILASGLAGLVVSRRRRSA